MRRITRPRTKTIVSASIRLAPERHGGIARRGGGGTVTYSTSATTGGTANAAGSADNASRGDHAHGPDPATALNTSGVAGNVTRFNTLAPEVAANKRNTATNATAAAANKTASAANTTALTKLRPAPAAADQGKIVRVADSLATEATQFVYDDPHAAILDGLPAITGQAGKVLKVNSGATALEWATGGGGGSTGGSVELDLKVTSATAASTFWLPPADTIVHAICPGNDEQARTTFWHTADGNGFTLTGSVINVSDSATVGTITLSVASDGEWSSARCQGAWEIYELTGGGGGGGGTNPTIPAPTAAGKLKHLRVNAAGGAYELADPPSPGALIKSIKSGSNVAGTETTYARTDHEHAIPTSLFGTPVDIGRTNQDGTATTLARSDHVHEGRTVDVFPSIPNDHADHEYVLTPNAAGTDVVWDHAIDDALMENAADIGAADRRIDDLVTPSFGVPYPEDGFSFSTSGCLFNVDLQKEVCKTVWKRPALWEYVKIAEHTTTSWPSHTQSFTFADSVYDLHAALESPVTAFRRYVVNAGWSSVSSGQTTAYFQSFEIGGIPPGGRLGSTDNAVFYNVNSNNNLTGNTGYARVEVFHDQDHKVTVGMNTPNLQGGVRLVLYGVR